MKTMPLFDINGQFGKPASGVADSCPTLDVRLQHMDKLGIGRSVVWNVEAVQHHSLDSNQRLLDQIAQTPGAADRIMPGLVISPLIAYEKDGTNQLLKQMDVSRTRALRFLGGLVHVTLCQCAPVVRAIQHLKPLLVMQYGETSPQDLLEFTALFPDVPIILANLTWPSGMGTFDLMRQRPNIMMEISRWHTWNGIELAVKHFGAERLFFGTGFMSHNGAAIAALARADISADERKQIAHANLDRLTDSTTSFHPARIAEGNRLWQRFLAGDPLDTDIVDAHGHLGPSAGYVLENQSEASQIVSTLHTMDRLGQETMIVSGLQALLGSALEGNELLYRLLKPHADRFLIYLAFNPLYSDELVPRFDEWFADPQFAGFKLLCSYWKVPVTDARFQPMWEYANHHRLPVLMHSWTGNLDAPRLVRDIAKKYPDLSLLLGHSGGTDVGRLEAEETAAECPNVYLEWCGSFCSTIHWEDTLKRIPPRQIVYGSDAAAHDIHWEMGRLLSVDAPREVLTAILGANMRRILARRKG